MEELTVKKWLEDNSDHGYGSDSYFIGEGHRRSYGSGKVYSYGSGCGYGDGSGYGYGEASGSGRNFDEGCGFGCGSGPGSGCGCGEGCGFSGSYGKILPFKLMCHFRFGWGHGDGDGIGIFNGHRVYIIDGVQTVITHIKMNLAKGYILNSDLTLAPCYVVKGDGYFAHGKTVEEARAALREKMFENMDTEEVIDKFLETFKKGEKYPGKMFFEWHHYLTGSCQMGRESFVRNRGLNMEDLFTVDEFIEICEDSYGGEVIKALKERRGI